MKTLYTKLTIFLLVLVVFISCQKKEPGAKGTTEITALPFNSLSLNDLSEFRSAGENWRIAGNVQADLNEELSFDVSNGSGTLVNIPDGNSGDPLYTDLHHGDIELKLEFMVPKGSNSGIYFQERYEVQILDSWKVEEPAFYDAGGIYEGQDDATSDGQDRFEGSAPRVNASFAPGLWQEYHILFRAPRFDDQGNKIQNARFDWIDLNGTRIQENVELPGPTRGAAYDDEHTEGALMIQGDHGPVAFRNIRYKKFSQTDSLSLGEMNYTVHNYRGNRTPVDFEELEVIKEGTTDEFNVSEISPRNDDYAIRFTGELTVPVSGDYFFQTSVSNGGNLYIDDELVVENTGEFEGIQLGNIVYLEEGTHELDVTYFQIMWGTNLTIHYEGPGMEKRLLIFDGRNRDGSSSARITVDMELEMDYPEIIGGFVHYGGEKRTHTVSVGHPEGVHYSYDLNRGTLLTFWRNPFADVTQMWQGRGGEQLLVPQNAYVEESSGIQVAEMGADATFENHRSAYNQGVTEYHLDELGRPAFISNHTGVMVTDKIAPSETGSELIRTVRFNAEESSGNKVARVAQGGMIELLPNGLYRIDGRYYIRVLNSGGSEPQIHENGDYQALFIPILRNGTQSEIQYELIW